MNTGSSHIVSYNLFDILGLKLINPGDKDLRVIDNYLGDFKKEFDGEPDISIEFKDEIRTGTLHYLGLNNAAFDENNFYFISDGKENIKLKFPFNRVGEKIYLESERNGKSIPLLNHLINFTLISKGFLAVHASAFNYNGKGILVMGWTKGGKTESLLAFTNHGAEYIGDEWVLVSKDGSYMFGNPVPITIWEWQLKYLTNLNPEIDIQKKILFAGIHTFNKLNRFSAGIGLNKKFPMKFLEYSLPTLNKQLKIRYTPDKFFSRKLSDSTASLDKLVFIMSWEEAAIKTEIYDWEKIARSMINSIEAEQSVFWEHYSSFRFAFPDLTSSFLEEAKSIQKKLIYSAFRNKESYRVRHPYPVDLNYLFEEMNKIIFPQTQKSLV